MKKHLIVEEDSACMWREYCKKNNLDPIRQLEFVMKELATGDAVLTKIHHVKAKISGVEND